MFDFTEFANYTANDRPVTTGAVLRYKPVYRSFIFGERRKYHLQQHTSNPPS